MSELPRTGSKEPQASKREMLPSAVSSALHIAAVSYEGSLFGWDVDHSSTDTAIEKHSLSLRFGFHCSIGSLRAVAVSKSGKFLVCAGMDERIRIFDLNTNKSLGELSQHTGAITSLEFFGDSYLLSGSDDHSVCIWRVHDWICVHILGGHKDVVTGISIHPSGKIALSVSKDGSIKMWNLIEGRCAFTSRLKSNKSASQVSWNSNGEYYCVVFENEVQVFSADNNSCTATIQQRSRINKVAFLPSISGLENNLVLVLCEDRSLNLHNTVGSTLSKVVFPEQARRARDMSIARVKDRGNSTVVVTVITSNGSVFVIDATAMLPISGGADIAMKTVEFEDLYQTSYTFAVEPRLTCVTSWTQHGKHKKKSTDVVLSTSDPISANGKTGVVVDDEVAGKKRAVRFDQAVDDGQNKKKKKNEKKLSKSEKMSKKLRGGFVMKTDFEDSTNVESTTSHHIHTAGHKTSNAKSSKHFKKYKGGK
jgi:protein MAK11